MSCDSSPSLAVDHSISSSRVADLHQFADDSSLNFVVLTRDSPSFQSSIDEVSERSGGKWSFTFRDTEDIYLIGAMLDEELELQSESAMRFYDDVMDMAKLFLSVTNSRVIGIQLEVVANDLCRLYHTDRVPYRLITTYKGPTTQWLPNSNVNRSELGKYSNDNVPKDKFQVHSLPEFSVGIFKGEKVLPGSSLVHRSPSLQAENEKRLIMRMDSIEI